MYIQFGLPNSEKFFVVDNKDVSESADEQCRNDKLQYMGLIELHKDVESLQTDMDNDNELNQILELVF